MLQLHEYLQKHPITGLQYAARVTGLSITTAGSAMERMADIGIVREQTGKRRGRVYIYAEFLKILEEGTDKPFPA
jgi:predicted transcriptional regulator